MKFNLSKTLEFLFTFFILSVTQVMGTSSANRQLKVSEIEDTLYKVEILRASKAAQIRSYIDDSFNPCNDFYKFACSNFPKYHPSKQGVASNMLQIMADALTEKIEKFLNSPESAVDTIVDSKIKEFYKSCTKIKNLTPVDYRSKLMKLVSEFGKMPVLSNNTDWDEQNFDWTAMVAKMQRQYAKPALLQLDVAPDFRNGSVNCLYIGQPKMIMSTKAMYTDNSTAFLRERVVFALADRLETFLGVSKELAQKTATEILVFESLLAQGMWDGKIDIERMYIPTTIEEWHIKYDPVIDVERLIALTMGSVRIDCLYEAVESFQRNLQKVLLKVPKYVVANYLFFMLLNDDFTVRSEPTEKAQNSLCQAKTVAYFNKALDNMVYRHYDNKRSEDDVKLIYEQLKLVLRSKFSGNELDWMSSKTRQNAIKKLDNVRFEINSYENYKITQYNETEITSDDYLENVKKLQLQKGKMFVQSISEPPKPLEDAALTSYSPANLIQENKIVIPVATLQPYFLVADVYPNSIKFGNLGTTLGHELLHSFDDEGRKYDEKGDHSNWWDLDSMQEFNKRKKCLVDQYSSYKFGDNYLRGDYVLSENIADNGGLKLAYDAYMLWYNSLNRTSAEIKRETLPQLKYTPAQLFFLSFAQFWCTDMSDDQKNIQTATDTHSPNMYRIIGSLSNSPEFSAAFDCPLGSPMNPLKKCKVY